MNRKRVTTALILVLIALALYRSHSASISSEPVTKTNYLMGTIVKLTLYDNKDESLFAESFKIIKDIESKMSLNIDSSEIDNINRSAHLAPVKVSPSTFEVIDKSLYYSKLSDGKFDISSGELVSLWGIGGEDARLPSQEEIDAAIPLIDYRNIKLDQSESSVFLEKAGMTLDLGGIAKGYAADEVTAYLKSRGVDRAIVDIGGNLFLIGENEKNSPWKVGVQNPFSDNRNDYIGVLKASNSSVVTSGVYERFLEVDGTRYHHILDPDIGYPADNELMGVTISCESSVDADGLSTSVFLLGLDDGLQLIETLDDVEAIFVTKSKEIYLSSGIDESFELSDSEFNVKR